jgi:malonyl-CoA reductase/3-hydroxypropionate dehydrogenase (NADP+)
MPMAIQRVLPGLHKGKTAVITGGSLGIGLQLGRFLAIAGARVLLSARSEAKLREAADEIIEELRGVGYPKPEERVHILPDIDVGDEAALQRLFEHSLELLGHVDFLINNAGISGAEEMVVDMTLDDWNRTMFANLISNYSLIRKYAPLMKARGSGVVMNVSSYFGGEKYVAVAYPNRADYAVSKAGQRVLAEILSRHLGPEIQINALAPGPVDGARLRGLGGAPGCSSGAAAWYWRTSA